MLVVYLLLFCASTLAYVRPLSILYNLEDAENIFEEFIKKHNKVYADETEKQERFEIFKKSLETVNRLRLQQPQASFDINHSSDWTRDEFKLRYTGTKPGPLPEKYDAVTVTDDLPKAFDWRDHNAVTPVKDQKSCGSCWAFSTTGTVEGNYAVKHKKLLSFSEQQLVSCDKLDGGCGGGFMDRALTYLKNAGGIESESDYPYEDKDSNCKFDKNKIKTKITGQKNTKFGNDTETMQALIDNGPISIAIWANDEFQFYKSGVIKCASGGAGDIDHGVLLVGYGTENGQPYWIIKNSWGTVYGDKGYCKVQRGGNPCGMDFNGGFSAQVA